MRIILVRPNWITRRMILPPLGLGYIVAAAKREGHECIIHDSWLKDETHEMAALGDSEAWGNADIIGVQVYQNTVEWTRKFFQLVRPLTNAKFVIGGPYTTALGEQARLEIGADCAVIAEFETDITKHLYEIMGGEKLILPERWIDVNEDPFPDWDAMPLSEYWQYIYSAGAPVKGKRVGFIQRTRGCPRSCTFCASGGIIMGKKVRFRNLSNVIEEVKYLVDRWGIDELWFQDDDVTINHDFGVELFKALYPFKLHVRLQMGIRTDHLTEEMLFWMKKAGVYYAGIGIESGSPRVLNRIKKELKQVQVMKGIRALDRIGIQVMGFFMFGLPTETVEEVEETVQWALRSKLHHAQFSIFQPYPGSEDYNCRSDISRPVLLKLQRAATRRFYLRPRILWGILRHFKWAQAKAIIHHDWVLRWLGLAK